MSVRDVTAKTPAPWGSRLLGSPQESSGVRRIRIQLLLTVPLLLANFTGMVVSLALGGFVLPGPSVFTRDLLLLDVLAAPVYAGLATVFGVWWGTTRGLGALRWAIDPDHVPTEAEQSTAAAVPRKLVVQQAALWFGGLVVLTTLYGLADPELIAKIAFAVGFSAIVVCANSYLIIEFALRPVTTRVLEAAPAHRRRGIGVFGRSLLAWILGSGVPVGGLMVIAVLALARSDVSVERLAVCVLALGGATLVFGLLLMTQTLAATVAPIEGVRRAMRQVEKGDLDVWLAVYDGTELGELQSGFNHMVQGLREREQIRDLFGRHVGQDVADAALAAEPALGGVETDAAALFIDIIGSTTMTATRPPTETVALLNRFFGIVVDEVERCGGLLNKFEGDAALAVFGTPSPLPDAAGAALACARAIRARLGEIPELTAGLGVAAGRVVAGNVGAHQRYEFTVIGDAVNEAARLCELAKQDSGLLLASASTVAAADSAEAEHWALGESVTLRGRVAPTTLARPR
ncbi:adenylate/guanylate cyclase domain-containing protein [Nocardia bhagyanarayanae]|uniref:Adenylate cyclase n=1 Tax=Nocardia bhagyanarayanae TaxID=1215925 RepID=A0A543F6S9_9NOCA|nr:adenylate/guanylate cyclase domain-containing protein [Nocardia bhagyanarayanae]TQM29545.1 adenylate cyclase [Nocardia bhagyanarayanae]